MKRYNSEKKKIGPLTHFQGEKSVSVEIIKAVEKVM